jgi:5-methylcytosine-specific restriction endonuclease McrA
LSGSAESGVSGVCIICNIEEPTDNTLLGGLRFHRGCYDRLQQRANALGLMQGELRAELDNPYSLAQRVMLILSRRRRQRAERAREMLFGLLDQSVADLKLLNAIVSKIHDVWIGLPPDWHERRRAIRSRDKNSCAECGVCSQLHLHHRKPIRLGGTHNLENLVLLCAHCRSEAQSGKELRYDGPQTVADDAPHLAERKVALIDKAIKDGRDVQFQYEKRNGDVSSRTVTPQQIRKLTPKDVRRPVGSHLDDKRNYRLGLLGYCHLRSEPRTFVIDRMYKLRLQ